MFASDCWDLKISSWQILDYSNEKVFSRNSGKHYQRAIKIVLNLLLQNYLKLLNDNKNLKILSSMFRWFQGIFGSKLTCIINEKAQLRTNLIKKKSSETFKKIDVWLSSQTSNYTYENRYKN